MAKDDKKTEPSSPSPPLASAPSSPSPDAGDSTASQLAALRLQLEQERRGRADAEAFAKRAADAADALQAQLNAAQRSSGTNLQRPKPKVVPGVKYYRINAPHYRHGALIPAGSVVRVEDEAPSKTWVEVKPQKGAVPLLKQLAPEVPDEADLPSPEEAAAGEAESAGKAKLGKGI